MALCRVLGQLFLARSDHRSGRRCRLAAHPRPPPVEEPAHTSLV